jgi:subtilisin family serine protease
MKGIRITHEDFEGRAEWGTSFVEGEADTDGEGHGTHVAGTIGSKTYGVAKKTTLIAVKVLDETGSGTSENVIAGIQWAVKDAKENKRIGKAVANLSVGGLPHKATNKAVAAAVDEGLFVAVAAGNSFLDASTSSPASEPKACTVGATDKEDNFAEFSNWGPLVDILAPGVDVLSLGITNDTATDTLSGTSMASPHIAGLGAYLLALEGDGLKPNAVCDRIKALSTKGKVEFTFFQTVAELLTNNTLAYNGNPV